MKKVLSNFTSSSINSKSDSIKGGYGVTEVTEPAMTQVSAAKKQIQG